MEWVFAACGRWGVHDTLPGSARGEKWLQRWGNEVMVNFQKLMKHQNKVETGVFQAASNNIAPLLGSDCREDFLSFILSSRFN